MRGEREREPGECVKGGMRKRGGGVVLSTEEQSMVCDSPQKAGAIVVCCFSLNGGGGEYCAQLTLWTVQRLSNTRAPYKIGV